ncbi:MAG: glycosyltransferase family 2 protein [Paludibacteraceae bacterium]|nr:glycosyltransferase family 2 protein [Paludibacteraceae bacterium]
MNPKISVIIPVYNAGDQIKTCLDAILSQTLKEIELICVLDCPTDGTDRIVEAYAQKDNRIKVLKNTVNQNIGESRNKGIEAATGDYIGFSDHDDYMEPTMYEKLYKAITKENSHVSMCERGDILTKYNKRVERLDDQKTYTVWTSLLKTIANKQNLNTVYVWNKIYDRKFIQDNNIRFPDNKEFPAGEDILFNFQVFKKLSETNKTEAVAYVREILYWHIFHGENTSSRVWKFDYICRYTNLIAEEISKNRLLSDSKEVKQNAYKGFIGTLTSGLYWANKDKGISAFKQAHNIKNYPYLRSILKDNWTLYDKELSISKNIIGLFIKLFG